MMMLVDRYYPLIKEVKKLYDSLQANNVVMDQQALILQIVYELDPNLISDSCYAFVAFCDELIMSSTCECQPIWQRSPLQLTLYKHLLAGEIFYERLQVLRKDIVENREAIKAFYLCLKWGFKGIHRDKPKYELINFMNQLEAELIPAQENCNELFTLVTRDSKKRGITGILTIKKLTVLGVTVLASSYLFALAVINLSASQHIKLIKTNYQSAQKAIIIAQNRYPE